MYDKVILMGRLTRDIELRYTASGTAVGAIGMAINRKWRGKDGEEREEATFLDVTAFGKQAETLSKYVKKGQMLFVEGRHKMDQWDDKNTGQKRSKLGIVLEGFQFIGGDKPKTEDDGLDVPH